MVFNGNGFVEIVVILLTVWLVVLTVIVLKMVRHYNTLTGGAQVATLKEVLEGLISSQKAIRGEQKVLAEMLATIKNDGLLHVQRVGLVRFNPFSDTGGSQSFTLALLNGKGSGLVMTSLYARTGHRWYIKEVIEGKGKELALSKEEQTAIKNAYE